MNNIVFASREIAGAPDWISELKKTIESIQDVFKCDTFISIQDGRLRIDYLSHSESEVKECDLKLTSRIISFRETHDAYDLFLYPFTEN